jgi:hypothetical protein
VLARVTTAFGTHFRKPSYAQRCKAREGYCYVLLRSRWCNVAGHGGDPFLKFQDAEELTSIELADVFEQMWQKRRYETQQGQANGFFCFFGRGGGSSLSRRG